MIAKHPAAALLQHEAGLNGFAQRSKTSMWRDTGELVQVIELRRSRDLPNFPEHRFCVVVYAKFAKRPREAHVSKLFLGERRGALIEPENSVDGHSYLLRVLDADFVGFRELPEEFRSAFWTFMRAENRSPHGGNQARIVLQDYLLAFLDATTSRTDLINYSKRHNGGVAGLGDKIFHELLEGPQILIAKLKDCLGADRKKLKKRKMKRKSG